MLSVVITAHNEGDELLRTVESVERSSSGEVEIIVIDEASTDRACDAVRRPGVTVIRHEQRVGVAHSRNEGARRSRGSTIAFIDGHQRFSPKCLQKCAALALERQAIVWPDVSGLEHQTVRTKHGATFAQSECDKYFTARWCHQRPHRRISRISSLRCPGYVVPRTVYPQVCWMPELRGWGGSEAVMSLKAFFQAVPILHLCGPLARHMFKKKFHYDVTSHEIWRNQALTARICFQDRTWSEYWLPVVFHKHLSAEAMGELQSTSVQDQALEFNRQKRRRDREYWTRLLRRPVPAELRRTTVGYRGITSA